MSTELLDRGHFGTDGIRGLVDEFPLSGGGPETVGRAIGAEFAPEGGTVVIGGDTRDSTVPIMEGLTRGLRAVGVDVEVLGVLPTPGIAYTAQESGAAAGIAVTASHNPHSRDNREERYNGIKPFNGPDRAGTEGLKVSDHTEARLNLLMQGLPDRLPQGGVTNDLGAVERYGDFLASTVEPDSLEGTRIAFDGANGAASAVGPVVLREVGADVAALFVSPDGFNINEGCGATATAALQEYVRDEGADAGIAVDGDADRLMLVDHLGRQVTGDHIMYILGVTGGHDQVVATEMTNLGAERAMQAAGITLHRADVGDRYVLEGMRRTGALLGGEQSGHIILPQLVTGDAMLAALQTLRAVRESGRSLAEWRDDVTLVPQKIVNIPVSPAGKALLKGEAGAEFRARQAEAFGDRGRVLIRPSGTEPVARVMVESDSPEEDAKRIASDLQDFLTRVRA